MFSSRRRLEGKVALVTGVSSGIGAELMRELARRGAAVAGCARREDRLQALRAELEGLGAEVLLVPADVTSDDDVSSLVAQVLGRFGRVDYVVANAGFGVGHPFEQLTLEDYRRQLETNLFGVLRTAAAVLPPLKASRGVLAVMGSVAGEVPVPGSSAYALSKAAVHAFAKSVGPELARHGVAVTLLAPGFVDSEIRKVDNDGRYRPEWRDPVPAWLSRPTDRVVRRMVSAMVARRRLVVLTGHGRLLVLAQRLAPGLMALALRRLAVQRDRSER